MQVKTFIYGTPLGFNFYEDDSLYKDYFKGFYISSREGRRLMINRLDNGETSYNFLCYRIAESGNRPNAFFGMSLVLDDYVYCADFGKLYNWFSFLFDKLVNERNLITKTESGLRYCVSKFVEGAQDVEWLKTNMPNILSSQGMKLYKYDTSFSDKKTGKIMLLNPDDKQETMINAFKQSRWICLTPFVASDNDCPELDYGEMSSFLDGVTKQLLPIAINPEEKHIPLLKKIYAEAKENSQSISEFLEKSRDEESKKQFSELAKRYYDMWSQQLPKIAQKISGETAPPPPPPPPAPKKKVCAKCGRSKEISEFADGDNICIECRKEHSSNPHIRVCEKCGKEKSISDFDGEDTLCRQCRRTQHQLFPFSNKYLNMGIAAALLLLIVGAVFLFVPNNENAGMSHDEGDKLGTSAQAKNCVEKQKYDEFVSKGDFKGAFDYIKDKDNFSEYKNDLLIQIRTCLLTIDNQRSMADALGVYDDEFFSKMGIDHKIWIDKWYDYAEEVEADFKKIKNYLGKTKLTQQEKNECSRLISKYNIQDGPFHSLTTGWKKELNKKLISDSHNGGATLPFEFKYRVKDGEIKSKIKQNDKNVGFDMKAGEWADIYTYNQKPSLTQGVSHNVTVGDHTNEQPSPYWRICIEAVGTYLFNCGDEIVLTITVTSKYNAQ